MAFGKETIGTAYVRILADGSALDKSVKDEMRKTGPTMHQAGKEGTEEWVKGAEDEFKSGASRQKLRDGITNALAKNQAVERYLNSPKWEETKRALAKKFGEAGEVAGANLAKGLIETGDFKEFNARIKRLVPEIAQATEQIQRKEDEFARKFRADMDAIGKSAERSLRGANSELVKQAQLHENIFKTIRTGQLDLVRQSQQSGSFLRRLRNDNTDTADTIRERWEKVSDALGTSFGRGSRNNFLNFFGSVFRNLSRLPLLMFDAGKSVVRFGQDIAKTFSDAGGWAEGMGAVLLKLGPSAAAAAVGIGVLSVILGGLASAANLALGTLTALASTIGFGLVGALIPLAPLIFPLIAGVAGLAFAFSALNKQTKKNALHPIAQGLSELKGLGKDVLSGMEEGVGPGIGRITKAMQPLHKLFHDIGLAFGDLATKFVNLMDKPGPQRFMDTFTKFIPRAIHELGKIVGNLTRAFSNLFSAAVPSSQNFLGWLVRITREFRKWVQAHPDEISGFIDKAVDSAKTLGRFLGAVSRLFFEIIGAGREAGDSMFQGMTDTINGWVDALQANPDILKNFFQDAKAFAGAVGEAVLAVGRLFDAIDNGVTRTVATGSFQILAGSLTGVTNLVKLSFAPWEALAGIFGHTGDAAKQTNAQLLRTEGFKEAADAADNLATSIAGVAWAYGEASRAAIQQQLQGATGELGAAVKTLEGAGLSIGTLTDAAKGSADAIDLVNHAFDRQQAKITTNMAHWADLKDGITEFRNEQGQIVQVRVPSDQVKEATDKWNGYKKALEESQGEQATFNKFSGNTVKALDAQQRHIQKVADNLGLTVKQFHAFPKDIRTEFLTNMPQTGEAALRLIDHYKALQKFKNIRAVISAKDVDLTRKQVENLVKQYNLTPKQKTTLLRQEGLDKLLGDIKKGKNAADDLGNQKPSVKMKGDKSDFDAKFHDVQRSNAILNGTTATVNLHLNDAAYNAAIADAIFKRNSLDGSSATVTINTVRASGGRVPKAMGGIVIGATNILAGEAGPEAIVPLNRPLHMVDPAVRQLSAIAQGLTTKMASGGVVTPRTIDASGWTIMSPTKDPGAVAQEVVNRLVATGY